MDGTKSRAFRSRLTTMLRALPCTRARVTRDSYESPSSPAPRRTASRDRVILLVVVLCLRCGFKVHSERDLLPPAGYKITIFIMRHAAAARRPGRGSHARRAGAAQGSGERVRIRIRRALRAPGHHAPLRAARPRRMIASAIRRVPPLGRRGNRAAAAAAPTAAPRSVRVGGG